MKQAQLGHKHPPQEAKLQKNNNTNLICAAPRPAVENRARKTDDNIGSSSKIDNTDIMRVKQNKLYTFTVLTLPELSPMLLVALGFPNEKN